MSSSVPKIRLDQAWGSSYHRSGWAYAIRSLEHLCSPHGILLDAMIEKKFFFGSDPGDRRNHWRPYTEPWLGFVHSPPYVPHWFGIGGSAEAILATEPWQQSMVYCRGLFTLSRYLAQWLQSRVSVPVCHLPHPTEPPLISFSMDRYRSNPQPMLVHIGWWLRKFHSFFLLPGGRLRKVLISLNDQWVNSIIRAEARLAGGQRDGASLGRIYEIKYLSNPNYDCLLSQNIVFLDLYDSSANNVVIECIARNTPILVNRHPAVTEYLGAEYPLYFNSLEQASALAENDEMIAAAFDYLRRRQDLKDQIQAPCFSSQFAHSQIYSALQ